MKHLRAILAIPLAAAFLTACASSGGGGGDMAGEPEAAGSGSSVGIRVVNSSIPPTSMNVRIRQIGGPERLLGSLSPSQTRTFRYSPPDPAAEYQLSFEANDGTRGRSETFTMLGANEVVWDTTDQRVRVSR